MDPRAEVGEIKGLDGSLAKMLHVGSMIRREHHDIVAGHHLEGKAAYHAKFHPDVAQMQASFLMVHKNSTGLPDPRIEAALNEVLHCEKEKKPASLTRLTRFFKRRAEGPGAPPTAVE